MIKLIRPYVSYDDVAAGMQAIFESGWFTKGENVAEFRRAISRVTGAPHAYLATSATTALWMTLKLLGIKPGDEVVVSDFSFPASGNVVEDLGAKPVYADVDLATFNMTVESLERKLTPRTKAVMFVDALGNPSGITAIEALCAARGIPLIEDAACAIGSSEHGRACGSFGEFGCFSFHPRKLITTGEGGAITCRSAQWDETLQVKLEHGAKVTNGKFDFIDYGYNFRMSEPQALMGHVQLAKLPAIVTERNAQRAAFVEQLAPMGFRVQERTAGVVHNVQSLVFRVPDGVDRDLLVTRLKERGVETTLGTYSLSGTTYYRQKYNDVQPNAELLQLTTITLPCYAGVDVGQVCQAIAQSIA